MGNNLVSFTDPTGMDWHGSWVSAYGTTWFAGWYWKEDSISEELWDYYLSLMGDNSIPGGYPGGYVHSRGRASGMSGEGSSKSNSNWDIVKDNSYIIEEIGGQTISIKIMNCNFSYVIFEALSIDVKYSLDGGETWSRSIEHEGIYDIMPYDSKTLLFGCFTEPPVHWKIKLLTHNATVTYIVEWKW